MKKINFYYFCLTLVFFCFFLLSPRLFSQDLLPRHQEWLSLVNPIITKTEKDVFLRLKTSEERDKFIQLFWTRRDPRPDTLENEFYQEYMKRVHYADLHFGHNTPKKGHETERGYFYLLLGPPLERQSYATQSNIWPLELWYYQGKPEYGLPSYFYLLFYQRYGMGEFKLYSPTVEGPEKLLVPTMSARVINRQTAYQVLKEISGELAAASISFIPGETTLGLTSLSSDTLISNLYALAEKQFSD
ncbi:MAG TPA: GWxTD domain-containing protein, partial [Candidatus Aminicenantes bacterium]|nr:GWxTD domain-containing protein [Candidatus Aminicenantes bacterium]